MVHVLDLTQLDKVGDVYFLRVRKKEVAKITAISKGTKEERRVTLSQGDCCSAVQMLFSEIQRKERP